MVPPPIPPPAIPFAQAFLFWVKLGFISFGGPAGQISVMHQELVIRRRWLSERRFLHALNYCMLLPGPEAQQLATYIGWLMHRTAGGLAAGALFVLPSLAILLLLSWVYMEYGQVSLIAAFFAGIKPAVVAIVLFAAWRIGRRILRSAWLLAIAIVAFVLIFALQVPFPWIVAGAGVAGYLGARFLPAVPSHRLAEVEGDHASAVIDDATPPPEHTRFRWSHALLIAGVTLVSWVGGFALLAVTQRGGILTDMAWFFSKAALVTFGGAYAVLPYVYQSAVEQYHWLTPLQMIDGLALGETTPGPLIIVVAFVGFVAAWTDAAALALPPLAAGVVGGLCATYFTFLPSFAFIFLGAPAVEATRNDLRFAAPLSGITAAVVGVIVNLAVFFAWHVFWPSGFATTPDWQAVVLAVLAAYALFRLRWGIIPVVFASGAAGVLVSVAGLN